MVRCIGKGSQADINRLRCLARPLFEVDPGKVGFGFQALQGRQVVRRVLPGIFPFVQHLLLGPHGQGGVHHPRVGRRIHPDVVELGVDALNVALGRLDLLFGRLFGDLQLLHHVVQVLLFGLFHWLCHRKSPFKNWLPHGHLQSQSNYYSIFPPADSTQTIAA